MFNAFDTIDLSYSDASYRLVAAKGGALGILYQMGKELLTRRMPSSRVWHLLQAGAKCAAVSEGVPPAPDEEIKPYDAVIVRKVVFSPKASAAPETVISNIARALTFFGNECVGANAPVVILSSADRNVVLPDEPAKRAAAIKNFFQPTR